MKVIVNCAERSRSRMAYNDILWICRKASFMRDDAVFFCKYFSFPPSWTERFNENNFWFYQDVEDLQDISTWDFAWSLFCAPWGELDGRDSRDWLCTYGYLCFVGFVPAYEFLVFRIHIWFREIRFQCYTERFVPDESHFWDLTITVSGTLFIWFKYK